MFFWSFFLGLSIALIYLFFRGSSRSQNYASNNSNKQSGENLHSVSKTDKYSNLKTHLEKAFAKKREQKSKFSEIFRILRKIIFFYIN